ncbi:MAG: hypothetical protein EHM19_06580 [Candidatus Latescibacterota bacterium]|nr:MAG: hypothetical protein EHM19_06580 [Candidatus Latescibacterota bacterium]
MCGAETEPVDRSDPEGDQTSGVLARVVRRLGRARGGGAVVIDDLHLAASPSVVAFLDRFARFLPNACTLILASREPVGVAAMKLQAEGGVARLGSETLRFTEEETAELFRRHRPGSAIPPPLLRRIVRRTEGWPAGIEVFFQGLSTGSAAEIEEALAGASEADAGWFSYFAEEVLRRIDPDERVFLLRTSVLPRLDPSLADRFLDSVGSGETLERLCRRNLFTFPVSGRGGAYRYHGIFRAFLRDLLGREVGEAGVRRLHRRAAAVLREEGAWSEAAEAYAEAGEPAQVIRIVESRAAAMIAAGRSDAIRASLAAVPRRDLDKRPAALLALARATDQQGEWEEAEAISRRALRASPPKALRSEILADLAQLRLRRGDPRGAIDLGREALPLRAPRRVAMRGQVLSTLGIAACELGKLDEGERYLRSAVQHFKKARDREGQLRTFYLLPANIYYRRGEFRLAKEAAREALVEFRKRGDRKRTCHCLGVLGYLCAETADVREARELTADSLRLAESLDYSLMLGYGRLALSRCARIEGNGFEAREQAEAAREIGRRLGEAGLLAISLTRLADAALVEGKRGAALRAARFSLETARVLGDIYQEAESCALLGLLRADAEKPGGRGWWDRAERIMRRVGMRFELHRLLLLRAANVEDGGRKERPRLAELMSGTEALGHDFLFLSLHREEAARVLARAVRLGVAAARAERLLVELGEPAAGPVSALLAAPEEAVRARAVEVLRRIGGSAARDALSAAARAPTSTAAAAAQAAVELRQMPRTPLRIRALGRLDVGIGDRTIAFGEWKSARALRLFQLLLIHRFRWVPREVAIETLWPEVEPERGQNNLRQSLHLLRKALEPDSHAPGGSVYVQSRNEACRLEPGEGKDYDVERFEEAVRRGESARSAGRAAAAEEEWRRAIELYTGPLFAESLYEEFAVDARESLREHHLRAVRGLIDLCSHAARWDDVVPLARRALAEDSWREEFHFELVQALHRLGNKVEALDAYHAYEEALIRELELLPSARMKSLAEKLTAPGA